MKKQNGFTLIELVVVIIVLGIIAAVALPKFVNLSQDAKLSVMKGMKGAIASARDLTFLEMQLHQDNFNANGRRYTLESGQQIRVRGDYPDGRWSNTFVHLVDLSDVTVSNTNACDAESDWCVIQKGPSWFSRIDDITFPDGRGFVIYPKDANVNQQVCYVYYYTPNVIDTTDPLKPVVGIEDSEC